MKNSSETSRISFVRTMFGKITPHYDFLNHFLSAGRDITWRKRTVQRLPQDAVQLLDVACGTGDLAIIAAKMCPGLQVTGLDFVAEMLARAEEKTALAGLAQQIVYLHGDALALPFPDNHFDAATIAFGLRNIPDRLHALREMTRVIRPGGKVLVLEMTGPESALPRKLFDFYLNHILPFIGGAISGEWQAYRYLPDSIREFLTPMELVDLFHESGLCRVRAIPMSLGITWLHEGIVP